MVRIVGLIALVLAFAGVPRLTLGQAPAALGGTPAMGSVHDVSAPIARDPSPVRYLNVGRIDLADVTAVAAVNGRSPGGPSCTSPM